MTVVTIKKLAIISKVAKPAKFKIKYEMSIKAAGRKIEVENISLGLTSKWQKSISS
jgi:hypothetical protein